MSPTNGTDERLAETLRALGTPSASVPALHPDLARELGALQAVSPRRPLRQLVLFAIVSLSVAGGLLLVLALRRDLELLPRGWLIAYGAGWFLGFLGLGAMALLPAPGQVSPRWRAAGIAAVGTGAAFVLAGLVFARSTPASTMAPATAGGLWDFGRACLGLGLITAITPMILGGLFLRGAAPVGARSVAWALGAAGGALGGLLLHLHCPIADHLHLGLIHGGVVVIGGVLSALIVDRLLRP